MTNFEPREFEPAHPGPDAPSLPRVLVLMATFNGAKWVGEQIRSVLAQQRVDVRIAVRDDGSSDETALVVDRFSTSDRRIALSIAATPSGSAAQNFFALIRAHSAEAFDYVALSDQDDIWHADKLSRSVAALQQSSSCAASTSTVALWPDGRSKLLTQVASQTQSDFLFEGAGQGCTFLLTATFYTRLRAFLMQNEALTRAIHYHDWSIYALARAWRLRWTFIREATLQYRQHTTNDTGARGSIGGIALRIGRIRGGWYQAQVIAIARLCQAAAPTDPVIAGWTIVLLQFSGVRRRLAIARRCVAGGRRRRTDNLVLIAAALLGAI